MVKGAIVLVDHGQCGAGRIGGGNGGHQHQRRLAVVRDGFGGIQCLATAHTDHHVRTAGFEGSAQVCNFCGGAFPRELFHMAANALCGQAGYGLAVDAVEEESVSHKERKVTVLGNVFAHLVKQACADQKLLGGGDGAWNHGVPYRCLLGFTMMRGYKGFGPQCAVNA